MDDFELPTPITWTAATRPSKSEERLDALRWVQHNSAQVSGSGRVHGGEGLSLSDARDLMRHNGRRGVRGWFQRITSL